MTSFGKWLGGAIAAFVRAFVPAFKPPSPAAPNDPAPAGSTSAPGVDPKKGPKQLATETDQMRKQLQWTGAALGGIATTVIGAVGFTRLDDILPFPATAPRWLWWATVIAASLGLLAATTLVTGVYFAQRRILIGSDLSGLDWFERHHVRPVARAMAADQGATSLRALDQRSSRLARIARELEQAGENELAAIAKTEGKRLDDVVVLSLKQLATFVMERRVRLALGGWPSTVLSLLAVGGLGFLLAVADYAKGQRSLPKERILRVDACIANVPSFAKITKKQRATLIAACVAAMTPSTSTSTSSTPTSTSTTTTPAATTTP